MEVIAYLGPEDSGHNYVAIIADKNEHILLMIMGSRTRCQSSFIKSTVNSSP